MEVYELRHVRRKAQNSIFLKWGGDKNENKKYMGIKSNLSKKRGGGDKIRFLK